MAFSEHEPGRGLVVVESPLTMDKVHGTLRRPEGASIDQLGGILDIYGMIIGDFNGESRGQSPSEDGVFNISSSAEDTNESRSLVPDSPFPILLRYNPVGNRKYAITVQTTEIIENSLLSSLAIISTRGVFSAPPGERRTEAVEEVKGRIQAAASKAATWADLLPHPKPH